MKMIKIDGYDDGSCNGRYCRLDMQTNSRLVFRSFLRYDPHSSSADTAGLTLILVDKIKALRVNTIRETKKADKTKPTLKGPLDECNMRYKTIVKSCVQKAYDALPRNPHIAEDEVADAKITASICVGGLPKRQSPLTCLIQRMEKICDVAKAIIRMLL